jgi:hypothetical protein
VLLFLPKYLSNNRRDKPTRLNGPYDAVVECGSVPLCATGVRGFGEVRVGPDGRQEVNLKVKAQRVRDLRKSEGQVALSPEL